LLFADSSASRYCHARASPGGARQIDRNDRNAIARFWHGDKPLNGEDLG